MEKMDLWKLIKELKSQDYEWIELSFEVSEETPHFSGFDALTRKQILNFEEHGANTQCYSMVSQYGTHVDPPIHFIEGGRSLHEIKLSEMVFPLCVIDVADKVKNDPDYALTVDDILEWESKYGKIPADSFVAMYTDWSKRAPGEYDGKDANGVIHNPGWSKESIRFLVEERQIGAIGHEPADTDPGSVVRTAGWEAESYYLGFDKIQIELLKNLDLLPPIGAIIFCTFPILKDGTGFTARCFAISPRET